MAKPKPTEEEWNKYCRDECLDYMLLGLKPVKPLTNLAAMLLIKQAFIAGMKRKIWKSKTKEQNETQRQLYLGEINKEDANSKVKE